MMYIYTDGCCLGNPGTGGWAIVITEGTHVADSYCGAVDDTTSNRMELLAFIQAFAYIKNSCKLHNLDQVRIISDSEYVVNGYTEWLESWVSRGWRTKGKKPVKNDDLWRFVQDFKKTFERIVTVMWTKGHVGNKFNEKADWLANCQAAQLQAQRRRERSVKPPPFEPLDLEP
jgi:ribonuclease HI